MGRPRGDSEQAKLKKRLRNERYRGNLVMAERNREKNKLYQQKKREQARLRLHQDPLAQLANIVTQQEYLQNAPEVPAVPEPADEQEPIDAGITVEEDGEILEEIVDGEWGGGFDGGFPDEPETNGNGRIDEGIPRWAPIRR